MKLEHQNDAPFSKISNLIRKCILQSKAPCGSSIIPLVLTFGFYYNYKLPAGSFT